MKCVLLAAGVVSVVLGAGSFLVWETRAEGAQAVATSAAATVPASTRKSLKVENQPFVEVGEIVVKTKLMDPERGLKPKSYTGEAGACETRFTSAFGYKTELPKVRQEGGEFVASLKVMAPQVKLTLEVDLWMPAGADALLLDHEETHRLISERVYVDGAKALSAYVKGMNNQVFEGRGASKEEAARAVRKLVLDTYNAEFQRVLPGREGKLNQEFDRLNKHGLDRSKTATEWMEQVFKEEKGK